MATAGQLTWERLVAIARRVGVEVVEAPSSHRGKKGRMGSVVGPTLHWTGTANSYAVANDYPDYNVVKEGRAGLVNSLSAYGIGRQKAIYVFSEFLSYHAGVWNYAGITDGNGHFLGIECAGAGDFTDWQRQVYPRLVAAILLDLGSDRSMAPTHAAGAMPRGRKSDIKTDNFYQGRSFYDWVDYFMANPAYININYGTPGAGGDDMANVPQEEWNGVRDAIRGSDKNINNIIAIMMGLNNIRSDIAALTAVRSDSVDEKALASHLLAGLLPQVIEAVGKEAGMSDERVAEISEGVVRDAFVRAGTA